VSMKPVHFLVPQRIRLILSSIMDDCSTWIRR
jgi:hypothetical protein